MCVFRTRGVILWLLLVNRADGMPGYHRDGYKRKAAGENAGRVLRQKNARRALLRRGTALADAEENRNVEANGVCVPHASVPPSRAPPEPQRCRRLHSRTGRKFRDRPIHDQAQPRGSLVLGACVAPNKLTTCPY